MNMKEPKVSVIIPVKAINDYIRESLPHLLNQDYQNFEIIIVTDFPTDEIKNKKVRIIPSGVIGPAKKRDLGAESAKGEILAFIDDDAYPVNKNWLRKAAVYFPANRNIAAVGGPNLTPPNSNTFQKASGHVLSSYLISGPARFRYKKTGKVIECDDLPSCNLLVRKSVFDKIGGFDSAWWPGEDTKLCRDIGAAGKKIVYDPSIQVYHYRRKDFKGYPQQIFNYAMHRGHFMKKIPENSLKLSYFIPSLFVIGLIAGFFLSFYSFYLKIIYLSVLAIYIILMAIEALRAKELASILLFIPIGFITHIIYGVGIIVGLLKPKLKSELRK